MNTYRIVYGGQKTIEAASEAEAYRQFWEFIKGCCDRGMLGLIVETTKGTTETTHSNAR